MRDRAIKRCAGVISAYPAVAASFAASPMRISSQSGMSWTTTFRQTLGGFTSGCRAQYCRGNSESLADLLTCSSSPPSTTPLIHHYVIGRDLRPSPKKKTPTPARGSAIHQLKAPSRSSVANLRRPRAPEIRLRYIRHGSDPQVASTGRLRLGRLGRTSAARPVEGRTPAGISPAWQSPLPPGERSARGLRHLERASYRGSSFLTHPSPDVNVPGDLFIPP